MSEWNKDQACYRFTSPDIQEPLYECPISKISRETPWIWKVIPYYYWVTESGAINPLSLPLITQKMIRIIGAEKSRLFEIKQQNRQSENDARFARSIR